MFYHVSIQQSIDLEPMYFGPKLRETICLKITDKVSTASCHGADAAKGIQTRLLHQVQTSAQPLAVHVLPACSTRTLCCAASPLASWIQARCA